MDIWQLVGIVGLAVFLGVAVLVMARSLRAPIALVAGVVGGILLAATVLTVGVFLIAYGENSAAEFAELFETEWRD